MSVDQAVQPDRKPSAKKRTLWISLLVLTSLLAVVAGLVLYSMSLDRDHIDNAKVGDCVRDAPDSRTEKYRIAPCADAAAGYKVLALLPANSSCLDVAGASRSVDTDEHSVCLGRKGLDPAKAVNVAKEGDCLDVISGGDPQRVDCADPKATKKVLKRVTRVPGFQVKGTCAQVPGADTSYSWSWETSGDPTGTAGLIVDVVLCLGRK
jgi:hypothetical protein